VSAGADRAWTLRPQWTQQVWGAQSPVEVQVMPALLDFIRASARAGVAVALSTWFRQDLEDVRIRIGTPADIARIWIDTLEHIESVGLLDHIAYVDLCNEFPLPPWAPFLYLGDRAGNSVGDSVGDGSGAGLPWGDQGIVDWMRESIGLVRAAYPSLDYTYSFAGGYTDAIDADVETFDLLEPHVWMAGSSDFYDKVGYAFERFEPTGYDNLAALGLQTPCVGPRRRGGGSPWPRRSFCGPQFVGMWRDVDYHRRLTEIIRTSTVDPGLFGAHVD